MMSRRSSTASEKKRGKSMTRSKSPFRSFRFKKKSAPDTGSEQGLEDDDTMRAIEHPDGELEGMLVRKHEWESTTKKASNRSWEKLCVVLKGSQIMFYKDQKTYRGKPEDTFRGELPVDLANAEATVAADYTKKKHVFRLKLENGGDYLSQAQDEAAARPGKSQTLPPGSEKKDEKKGP